MRFVLDTGTAVRECTADLAASDVTLAELLVAAGVEPPPVVGVDGRSVPSDHLVEEAGLCEGSTLTLGSAPTPEGGPAWDGSLAPPRLAVVAGAGAGRAVPLARSITVGRAASCDLVVPSDTVSQEHCRVVRDGSGGVRVTDLGSTNGTWVGGHPTDHRGATAAIGEVIRVGAVVLRVEPPIDDAPTGLDPLRRRTAAGTLPFNRPPRPGPPRPVEPVSVPDAAAAVTMPPPLQLAALLVPVLLGAVMVVALGSWRYAAFMALSPALLLATTLSGRRRARREGRRHDQLQRTAVAAFRDDVARAAADERARRWAVLPSVAEVVRRATQPSTHLWERRPDHGDHLVLQAGVGGVPWSPPLPEGTGRADLGPDVGAVLDQWHRLPRSPVHVDLADGGVVGITGERGPAVDLARSLLLQACVHHGPADLAAAVVVDDRRVGDWAWSTWLPHTSGDLGRRLVAAGAEQGRSLLAGLRGRRPDGRTTLVVIDAPELLHGRDADARAVLRGGGGPVAGVVLAETADQLPAVCDTVIEVGSPAGEARLTRPVERSVVEGLLVAGASPATCLPAARRLAGLDDPEQDDDGTLLPQRVDLLDLLDDGLDVGAAWDRTRADPGLRVPIGVGPDGPVELDLLVDGPHALLGGTTGSGKSELLRTLVAGLAARHDPDHCTFVLVDYKGGAAFDACADLPHVVGVVTDLDEHLGARALRCLEAELAHREERLRAAAVDDLTAWHRLPVEERGAPLPRLLVVVDEFATLRAELPDFVDALVGIAQRGRSLGVHLVLGTQRPSGAVDENVRANANLRIALRMTDDRDAVDVVGVPDAAAIPPAQPGRGLLRTGPDEPVPVQTALVTGRRRPGTPRVRVAPLRFGDDPLADLDDDDAGAQPSDLELLVSACRGAAAARGLAAPRSPWPPPLPDDLRPEDLPPGEVTVPLGLLDDPDRQRQVTVGWEPARGNLLVHGAVGSGTTTTLATVAIQAARRFPADELHLYVLDMGGGGLAPLVDLPHCGAVVTAREPERVARLEAHLLAEVERRRGATDDELRSLPLLLLLVDGLATWLADLDGPITFETFEAVQRLLTEGPRLRMAVVGSVPRPGALRTAVTAATEQWLVHRLADPDDVGMLGLRRAAVQPLSPGRALRPGGGVLQVARVDDLAAAVADVAAGARPAPVRPTPIAVLPDRIGWDGVRHAADLGRNAWFLPLGVDVMTLAPVGWTLHRGDHAVVLGPAASGRSELLRGVAALAAGRVGVVVLTGDDGPWPDGCEVRVPSELPSVLAEVATRSRPTLVLVDDADRLPDPGPALDMVLDHVHVVAAARQEVVEADYGHWVRRLARSRTGLFLRPLGLVAGDLLGARLPRRPPIATGTSRGWFVGAGEVRFVQTIGADA